MGGKKHSYFLSDFHLGIPDRAGSLARERRIIQFLDEIAPTAEHIFFVGDVFDFWFEYRHVVPKHHVRLLGKLAALSDAGIQLHFFKGNHDMWTFGYLQEELGMRVHDDTFEIELHGKRFFIGHGDGKGPGDKGFKRLKKVFRHPLNQWLFARLHPNLAFGLARHWSYKSREAGADESAFLKEKEWLYQYCQRKLAQQHYDYFVFGHRHLPICTPVGEKSLYINLGDWIVYNTYAVFDGENLDLRTYPAHEPAGFGRA